MHVAAWRSAYPGILPDEYLARLSPTRMALQYRATIASGATVMVAASKGQGPRIVGFTTAGPPRTPGLGDAEIETLYVLDDWRDRGVGRGMMQAAATQLAGGGLPLAVRVGAARQPEPLVLPPSGRPAGG